MTPGVKACPDTTVNRCQIVYRVSLRQMRLVRKDRTIGLKSLLLSLHLNSCGEHESPSLR